MVNLRLNVRGHSCVYTRINDNSNTIIKRRSAECLLFLKTVPRAGGGHTMAATTLGVHVKYIILYMYA